jgi:eukaryotic-like serine/threonine-protein kinase
MTVEQWQEARTLFAAALERAPGERAAFIASSAAAEVVRERVRQLLLTHDAAPDSLADFLETPAALTLAAPGGEAAVRRVGPYALVREIGRGGMATVHLAVRADDEFRRQVAVKLVWPGLDGGELIRRFRRERQILADLDHPHIARLLDGGTTEDGWPYLVMEYVDGLPITDYCERHKLPLPERLRLFQAVCGAVEYAHARRVVHRDLKPANILITTDGVTGRAAPKLLDFGIAKLLGPAGPHDSASFSQPSATRTGLQLMTPEYASPEQIRGAEITAASDVYSLGVVLYELLTGERPYRLKSSLLTSPHEIARLICEHEPTRPSEVMRRRRKWEDKTRGAGGGGHEAEKDSPSRLPPSAADLDNITLKALGKDARERYASAAEFSEDLRRYLAGEAVLARSRSPVYRAVKFARRNRAALIIIALLTAALAAGAVYTFRQARLQRRQLYAAEMSRAMQDWEAGNLARIEQTLDAWQPQGGREDLRGFEWYYLRRLLHRERLLLPLGDGDGANFADNGRLLVQRGGVKNEVRDLETGRLIREVSLSAQTFDTQQNVLLVRDAGGNRVEVINWVDGRVLHSFAEPSGDMQSAWTSGWQVFTGHADGTVKMYAPDAGRDVAVLKGEPLPVIKGSTSNDARRMWTLLGDGATGQLWDLRNRRVLLTWRGEPGQAPNFSHDGKFLFTITGREVRVLDAETGRELSRLSGSGDIFISFNHSLDGKLLAVGSSDRTAKIYELPSLKLRATFAGHTDWVHAVNISPDGRLLVTGSSDRTARLWDIATARPLAVVRGHTDEVRLAMFSPDARYILTSGRDRTARVWDVAELLTPDAFTGHGDNVFAVAFAPDSRRLATASADGTAKLWDALAGHLLTTLRGHAGWVFCAAFAPDGRTLATGGQDAQAILWDAQSGRELRRLPGHKIAVRGVAFSPDGARLATAGSDGLVKIWEAATGREVLTLSSHTGEVLSVTFSPDGGRLVSTGWDGTIRFWDARGGRELMKLAGHESAVWSAKFSPDGRQLATGGMDRMVKLWDAATGRETARLAGHADEVFAVAFSPDGGRLATASNDRTVKIWHAATGQELITLKDHTDQVWSVAFSPDGRTLVSGSWDKTARLWRTAGGGR